MPRPHKCRRICFAPKSDYFKPSGVPVSQLEVVLLSLDETEALRLADILRKEQNDAARSMKVSRQTFGNILRSARRKISDCLINSKALRIEGGNVVFPSRHCPRCGKRSRTIPCPTCRRSKPDNLQNECLKLKENNK